jgi:excinuclease ABC subunit C
MKNRLQNVPLQPGVYLYKDKEGQVIYVGKARLLRQRMRSYFQAPTGQHPKVRAMMARVTDFDYIVTSTEVEALILENNLIKAYKPRYNIDLRDDKSYPYLKLTTEKFPRLCIVREKKDQISRYFGPYTDATSLRETIKLLTGIFPLRTCKSLKGNQRACLNYDMGKCLAPCNGRVTPEEYSHLVAGVVDFLEGHTQVLSERLSAEMQRAAARLEFEQAARLRDQLSAIQVLHEKQQVSLERPYQLDIVGMIGDEQDGLVLVFKLRAGKIVAKDTFWLKRAIEEEAEEVLGFFLKRYYGDSPDIPAEILVERLPAEAELLQTWLQAQSGVHARIWTPTRGEKKRLLDMVLENARLLWEERMLAADRHQQMLLSLAHSLELEIVPARIECYDISHLGGEETVASMVVATEGQADRKAYRRFKMKVAQNNDFASLREVLQRRFNEARQGNPAFLPEPDLLLIDGGLGQANAAQMIVQELGLDIPVFGLAKKREELFRPGCSQPLILTRRNEGLKLLQRLRDEAHRFAVGYNRQRRGQKLTSSVLDDIAGVGAKRKQALLVQFGSVAKIKTASREELLQVPGLNHPTAERIYTFFHPAE